MGKFDQSEFEGAIRAANDRKDFVTARRIRVESQICCNLVNSSLKLGLLCSVHDGEEATVIKSSDGRDIIKALFTTDEDMFTIHNSNGLRVGWFKLIYGNDGYDVISDYSANEISEKVYRIVKVLIDKLEMG